MFHVKHQGGETSTLKKGDKYEIRRIVEGV